MNSLRFWSRRAWFLHGYLIATLFLPPFPMVRAYWTDSNSDGVKEEVANPAEGDSWWSADSDNDHLTNEQEVLFGSDPYNLDCDRDGLTDYVEFLNSQAAMDAATPLPYDPWQWDTNANGFSDYDEYYQPIRGYQPVVNYTSLPGGATWPAGTFKTYSDADGDGIPNPDDGDPLNMDRDGDGLLNWNEAGGQMDDATNGYVEPPPVTDPGVNIGGYWYPTGTLDSDNDGTPDHLDAFPFGSFWYNNTEYAGVSNDRDSDGVPDPADIFPDGSFSYLGTEYGGIWVDQDGDGVPDVADAWPTIAGSYWYNNSAYPGIWSDQDGDGIPDPADATPNGSYMWGGTEYLGPWADQDGDGTPDAFDAWPEIAGSYTYNGATYSGSMPDQDGDQVPDWADPFPTINGSYTYEGTLYPGPWVDQDNDSLPDAHDPFPSVAGSYTYGGTLYPGPWVDQDNDGLPDAHDPFPSVAGSYWYNATQYAGAWVDSDNDGTPDAFDFTPNGSYWYNGTEHAGTWADSDSDGTPNAFDPFPNGSYWYNGTEYAGTWADSDGDSIPDPQDPFPSAAGSFWYNGTEYGGAWNDADTDGIPDSADATPNGGYWYGSTEYAGTWSDQDGDFIPDPADATPNGGYWYNGIEYAGTLSDQDSDGIPDPQDSYPNSRWNGAPYYPYNGSEYPGAWADYDNDGVPDPADNWSADSENGADNDTDGLSNYDERTQYGTNPDLQDTDGDQLDDKGELFTWHTNPLLAKTDPRQPYTDYHMVDQTDTDTDGIPDRIEQFYNMNLSDPNDALGDLDGDGYTNLQAYQEGWNLAAGLYRYDADADGILDVLEDAWSAKYPGILSKTFFNDSVQDYDGDGVLNFEEVSVGLDPGNANSIINAITDLQEWTWLKSLPSTDSSSPWQAMEDADHNGAPDGLQAFVADGTVPLLQRVSANDCDGDGMPDLWEHRFGTWKYPSGGLDLRNVRDVLLDPDQDGLNNLTEFRFGSDPLVRETNRDGVKDSKRLYNQRHTPTATPTATPGGLMNRYRSQVAADLRQTLNKPNSYKVFGVNDVPDPQDPKPDNAPATFQMLVLRHIFNRFQGDVEVRPPDQQTRDLPSSIGSGDNTGSHGHICMRQDCLKCEDGYKNCDNVLCEYGKIKCTHTTNCPVTVKGGCPGHTQTCPGNHIFVCEEPHDHSEVEGCRNGESCACGDGNQCTGRISVGCPGVGCPLMPDLPCPSCLSTPGIIEINCPYATSTECPRRYDCPMCEKGLVACDNTDCECGELKLCACKDVDCRCYGNAWTGSGDRCPYDMEGPQEYWRESAIVSITYNNAEDVSVWEVKRGGKTVGTLGPNTYSRSVEVAMVEEGEELRVEVVEIEPPDDPDSVNEIGVNDSAGSRYRKIGLNGLPMADSKPQDQDESGELPEETYLDAYTRQLRHSVSDIYATAEGSLLPLTVRRDVSTEIWSLKSGLRPEEKPFLPFGSGWSTNLCSYVKFEQQMSDPNAPHPMPEVNAPVVPVPVVPLPGATVPDVIADGRKKTATVVDEQGALTSYIHKSGPTWLHNGEERLDAKTIKNTFTGTVLQKKFGTTCFYEDAAITQRISSVRAPKKSAEKTLISYSRLLEVRDRLGNRLCYQYDGPGTLIPSRIYDPERPGRSIQIIQQEGRVIAVQGPDGQIIQYGYNGQCLASVQRGNTTVAYTYETVAEMPGALINNPSVPVFNSNIPDDRVYHVNLHSIKDELGRDFILHYEFDHSRAFSSIQPNQRFSTQVKTGLPRTIAGVTTPGGTIFLSASWVGGGAITYADHANVSPIAYRECIALDGTHTSYRFTEPKIYDARQVHSLSVVKANSITVTYAKMSVTQSKGSQSFPTETYIYNPAASFALAEATDRSGNTTTFTYGADGYDDPLTEKDAMNGVKTFTYDPATRIMTSMTDALGARTQYTLENNTITRNGVDFAVQGLKTAEITTALDGSRREARYSYENPVFAGLVTKRLILSSNETVMPSSVTTTTLGAVADSDGANTGWWAEITQTTGTAGAGGGMGTVLSSTTTIHDLGGGKRSVIDGRGLMTHFDYDEHNRLTKVTHADGTHKDLSYDAHGNLIAETNENGVTTFHEYDDLNRRFKSTVDLNGNGVADAAYQPGNSTLEASSIEYDGDIVTSVVYNSRNQVVSQTDARGMLTVNTYDDAGRLTASSKAGQTTEFFYDGINNGGSVFDVSAIKPNRTTDPRGTVTMVDYDALYRPVTHTVAANGITAVTLTTYDALGHPRTVTDPLQRVTTHTYNGLGELVQVENPDGTKVSTAYAPHGKPWQVTDENGKTTTTTYDALGRPVMVTSPAVNGEQAVQTTEYDAAGNVIRVTDALGRETETEYDVRNRPVAVYAPPVWDAEKGKFSRPVTQTTYDALGQVLTVTDPLGNVTRKFYDEAGRNWKVVAPAPEAGMVAPTTITTFDAGGLALTVTNALNQTVTNSYDIHGRLITTVDAAGITNTFAYDAAGNRTSVKDGKDQETTFGYDGLNRLTWQTFANGDTWNYSYNAVQKLSQTSPRGITTRYTYDARDRLLTTSAPGLNRSYSYDATGRLLSVTEADHEAANVSYEYDALGRVTKETSRGVMHSYSYDLAGNRVRADYGTGRSVQTGYDALNRPELISEGGRVTQYGYDLAGRAVILVAGNGQTSQNSYDALGRLVDRTLFKTTAMTDSEVLAEFSWTHDALGNVRQQLETWPGSSLRAAGVRSTTMTYDANNRLASETVVEPNAVATTTTYAYDAANNRLQKTVEGGSDPGVWHYTYNAANQLTHWEQWDAENGTMLKSAALGYDEAGNRTTQNVSITGGATGNGINPPPAAGGTTSYAWDAQDRLSGVTLPDGTQHAYEYDYRTRRIGTQKLFAAVQQAMTAIVFAGGLSLAEFDTTTDSLPARPSVEYVRGPDMGGGVGGMLYSMRASGTKYSLSNGRGDIVAQADSSATLTWTASYEAYGRRTTETGVNQDKQRGNSKDEDPTGLLNEGFRYRDLETGVWLSRDPAGFVDGPNVYAYCTQNPWSFFDPKGLDKHWHHRYPKAESFLKNFLSAGIDVHDKSNGLFVDAGAHSDLHSSTKGNYNGEWKNFFESKEWSNATTQSAKKTACENFLNKIEGPKGKAHAYLNAGNAFPTEVGYETWDKHRGNTTWKSTIIQGSHSLHRARIAGLAWANDIDVKSKTPDGGSPKTKSNVPDVPGGKKLRAPGILGLVLGGATLSLSIKQNGVAQGVSEWGQDQIPVYGDIKGIINDYEGHQAMKDVVEMDKAIDKVFYEDLHESIRNHPIP